MMRSLGIVPEQPVNQLVIKSGNVISKQCPVIPKKLLIKGTIESLHMRIHLGRTGIRVEMYDLLLLTRSLKVKRELRPIVCLYGCRTIGQNSV